MVKLYPKGEATVVMAAILGMLFIIVSIVIVLNVWQDVAYTECWKDAVDQMDALCLGGGILGCTAPGISSEIEHSVKFGSCVNSIYIVDKEHSANALLDAGFGDSAECEWSLRTFIILVPNKPGFFDTVGTVGDEGAIEATRQRAMGVVCKGYNTLLQDTNMKIRGPTESSGFVEYCLTVKRLPATDDDTDVFKVEASESAC